MPVVNPSVGNLEDTRRLKELFDNVFQRLSKLEGATLPFAINQQGPLPGTMRAVAINDAKLKASMWANYTNIGPGSGPYSAVTDAAGVIRAEWGNLAANGNSPAQFGFRANDATAAPIFDSLGVLGIPKLIGSVQNFSQQSVTGTGAYQTVTGSTVTFTPARQGNFLVLASGTLLDPTVGDTAFTLSAAVLTDGAYVGANGGQWFNSGGATPITPFAVAIGLSAASHNFALGVNQTSGKLWSYVNGYIFVFQIGS